MLDQKVVEEARQAWDKFMQQVNRMECRMLTAMAEEIDKQWADMAAPVAVPAEPRHDAATWCGERHVSDCRSPDAAADETSQPDEQPLGAFLNEENDELRQQVATLKAEVERLRMCEEERESVQRAAAFLTKLADRLGGGE